MISKYSRFFIYKLFSKGQFFTSGGDVIARGVKELRVVYKNEPNSKLQDLIDLDKDNHP